ncbi:MAG: DUF3784 domain-containing protein [Solirubrobacterales bacterium]
MILGIVLFFILGVLFYFGKGTFLLAGYNTMSKEEKAKYDEKALFKFMGKAMFVISFSNFLMWFSNTYNVYYLSVIGFILFFGTITFILIYVNTKNRFRI